MDNVYEEERVIDGYFSYTQRWLCEPPAIGVGYKVLEEEWLDDLNTRVIKRIEIVD